MDMIETWTGFSSPVRNNAFARPPQLATPSIFQQGSHNSLFPPQQSSKTTAPPFSNPAFTTPRKLFDDQVSGPEDSPALTETSDLLNDTPDADRLSDVNMGNTITPSKVDKTLRYPKKVSSTRKHASGKGEIVPHRHPYSAHRRRKQYERDFYQHGSEDSESESDGGSFYTKRGSKRPSKPGETQSEPPRGLFNSFLHVLGEHPNLPDILHKWIWFTVCLFLGGATCYTMLVVFNAIRSDILTVNEAARSATLGKMGACQKQYIQNQCATTEAPKLLELCEEWYECMTQNTDVRHIRVLLVEISEILNDVTGSWSLKTSVRIKLAQSDVVPPCAIICTNDLQIAIVVGLLIWVLARSMTGHATTAPKINSKKSAPSHGGNMTPEDSMGLHHTTPSFTRSLMETPQTRRYGLMEEDTDTDHTPPVLKQLGYTRSRSRSPQKRERSGSPMKYLRSPGRGA